MTSESPSMNPAEMGYMTLITGLLDAMEELNGADITEEMMCTNGKRQGENIGKKIGENKDPQTAVKEFLEYIKPYYDIELKNQSVTESLHRADIQFKDCMIKKLCKNCGIHATKPLCLNTHSLFEGALSAMTGMKVEVNMPRSGCSNSSCEVTVEFKPKNDKFQFLESAVSIVRTSLKNSIIIK